MPRQHLPATPPHPDPSADFGHLRDGVCLVDADGRIRYANASLLEILHLVGGGEVVEHLWDALPGGAEGPHAGEVKRALEGGGGCSFRVEDDGGRVWAVECDPRDDGGLRLRWRNVTAQARMEEMERRFHDASLSLAEREARLEAIVEGAPVGIVLLETDDAFTVREANDAYHAFLEGPWREPGSIVGVGAARFLPRFEESGLGPIFRGVRDSGEAFVMAEFEFHGFERGVTFFRWTLKPLLPGPGGRPRYLLLLVVEVTEQVLARRAAEAERKALYDVLDTLPIGVIVAEAPSGRTIYLNPAGAALAGRSPAELNARGMDEYVGRWDIRRPTGDPFPTAELPLARALEGETTRETDLVLCPPGGAERTVLASGVPIRDAHGRVDRAIAVFYDVSERLRLERALLARTAEAESAAGEAALRAEESRALREMGRALVSALEPGDVLRMAAAHARELLGARGSQVTTPLPDGRTLRLATAQGTLAALDGIEFPLAGSVVEQMLREGRTMVFQSAAEIPSTSGMFHQVRRTGVRNLLFVPMRAFGEMMGVLGVVDREGGFGDEEIRLLEAFADSAAMALYNARLFEAERRRAEESRALLEAAEALTSTLDPGEVMDRIVHIAMELLEADGAGLTFLSGEGRDRITMPVAAGVLAEFRGTESPLAGALTQPVVAEGRPRVLRSDEMPHSRSAAGLAAAGIVHFAVVPLREGGEVTGTLGTANRRESRPFTAHDLRLLSLLADQAALAVRNARVHEAAQAASRSKSEFLAMMSHELRTPLNALAGYSSLLEEGIYGPLTGAQQGALARMRTAREHLMELIEQVLDVARVEAGRKEVNADTVPVGALVAEVAEALRGAAESKGLSMEVEAGRTGTLRTDARMVRQIVTNLVGNAIKFTDRGGVTVSARADGGGAVVEVADTGPGIDPAHHERIFEPFFQVDTSTTRREGGSGLGLALSREFARLLGGELSVRSEPGRGSVFVLQLPPEVPERDGSA